MLELMDEVSNNDNSKLHLIVLGASGAGKSRVAGTAPGKILYIHTDSERHGPASAKASGGTVLPVCIDRTKDGDRLDADAAFEKTLRLLDPAFLLKNGIDSIVLDGLTELEKIIRQTKKWANSCLTDKGKHNNFAEPAATVARFDEIFRALNDAQDRAGCHVIVTGILDVMETDDNGAIAVAKPRLSGYSVAESLVQQFADILVVGRMVNAKGDAGYVLQTGADVTRVSKDLSGVIKKMFNFSPRITGAKSLPPYIKADLAEVIKLKTGETK